MEDMIDGYKDTRRILRALRTLVTNGAERQIVGDMIGDCDYSLQWMQTGRRPGNRRGIERRAAYQREKLMDPIRMQSFVQASSGGSPANLSEDQRSRIREVLSGLTERERDCYVMAHGECFSLAEIGRMIGISKGTVHTYVQRAQKKISDKLGDQAVL
ncbi:sigma-70 family RNA polymerase sigma factor [Paenibacillus oenotherae]|uniref:Sigma-70 family RNA polymerase sigma factor n=1 Tax=Paenibacillus oenotherae TaxID=1435645 RepID=A0ABS7DBD7_9BACL|nr:sigma-70 family RNA polymerase sigma factor [Paenibacillus oenotherae]MBW7477254.1 sigma-70 family RNA polymerase sigma factor [Paenibacillus oenotherae]